jgi:hypothetical protein
MSALFEDITVRPMRDRQGVKLSSSGVQNLYSRNAYKKGDSGHAFEKKFVTICDGINSGIDVPQKLRHDSRQATAAIDHCNLAEKCKVCAVQ